MTTTRAARIEARISSEALAAVKRAAEIQGRSVSDFVVAAAHDAAQRTIAETQVVRLALANQHALVRALLAPPAPSAGLRRARAVHRRLVQNKR